MKNYKIRRKINYKIINKDAKLMLKQNIKKFAKNKDRIYKKLIQNF